MPCLVFVALACLFMASPARALDGTDIAPGAACATEDAVMMTANPSGTGGYILTCSGGVWVAQISAATPVASDHVTTKGYVDTAVAAAGGVGGGLVCVESKSGCLFPFANTGMQKQNDSVSHNICCTGIDVGGTCDSTPNAFSFTNATNTALGVVVSSDIVALGGVDAGCSVQISITGDSPNSSYPQYRICETSNCSVVTQDWTQLTRYYFLAGNYIQVRTSTKTSSSAVTNTTATVGGVQSSWTTTNTATTWQAYSADCGENIGAMSPCPTGLGTGCSPNGAFCYYDAWAEGGCVDGWAAYIARCQ